MRLNTKRVRNMRRYIQANRCPRSPGLIHDYRIEYDNPNDLSQTTIRCYKCGKDQP